MNSTILNKTFFSQLKKNIFKKLKISTQTQKKPIQFLKIPEHEILYLSSTWLIIRRPSKCSSWIYIYILERFNDVSLRSGSTKSSANVSSRTDFKMFLTLTSAYLYTVFYSVNWIQIECRLRLLFRYFEILRQLYKQSEIAAKINCFHFLLFSYIYQYNSCIF